MTHNLKVQYLYRDGGNNKKCQSVVLANPDGITPEQLEEAIRSQFSDLQVWPDIFTSGRRNFAGRRLIFQAMIWTAKI